MAKSILDLEDPYVPNLAAAAFADYELQSWNKNRSIQARKEPQDRDPRYWVPYTKRGGRVYYRQSDLTAYMERNHKA